MSKLIDLYYNYCLNGWLPQSSKEYISALDQERAFKEKVLPMLVYSTGEINDEHLRIEQEKNEKSIVLNDISKSSLLKNSVLVLKGLSVERFYHANATRFAFDADLVALEEHLPQLDELLKRHSYDIYSSTPWIKDVVSNKVFKSFRYTKGPDDDRGFEIHIEHYPIDDNGSRILLQSLYSGCYNTILNGTSINVVSDLNAILIMLIQIYYKKYLTVRDFVDLVILLENSDFQACKHTIKTLVVYHNLGSALSKLREYVYNNEIDLAKYPSGSSILELTEWEINSCSKIEDTVPVLIAQDLSSKELFDKGIPVNFYRLSATEVIDDSNCFKVETNIGTFYGQSEGDFLIYE
ncbi:TPA: nucleotidyltransferase family protein [Vibrio mimicus]